jgi:hypothetical protein
VTTRAEMLTWLSARRPAAPEPLAAHLATLVHDGRGTLPELLAAAGTELLGMVVAAPGGGRELALDLLAADALVTYAFEAQAELDIEGLAALAARLHRGGDLE